MSRALPAPGRASRPSRDRSVAAILTDLRYLAHPFGRWRDGSLFVFVEACDHRDRHGVIDVLVYDAALDLVERGPRCKSRGTSPTPTSPSPTERPGCCPNPRTGGHDGKTSRRLVPFHEELERLRLPEYVAALREAGETLLFPELVAESGKGTMGDAFYKLHWTKIARCLDFIEPGQAIHSFRHTVADELKAQFVFEEVRADLVGHRIQSETGGRYSKRARLEPLHKAVNSIPNVTSTLLPPPVVLLPAGRRKPRPARRPRGSRPI